jgi:hypothetical protein
MPILTPEEVSIEAYHSSAPQWMSKTTLKDFCAMGPRRFNMTHLLRTIPRPKKTEAMEQGSMIDCFLTEGETVFNERYVLAPPDAPKKPTPQQLAALVPSDKAKESIAYWARFEGKNIISAEDYAILLDVVEAVHDLPMWPRIRAALVQRTVRRPSAGLGFGLQSRPDWLELDSRRATTFDLKKVDQFDRFPGQALDLDYHTQSAIAGWCLAADGFEHADGFLVPVEWARGARANVYKIPSEVLADGFRRAQRAAEEIAERLRSGNWKPEPVMFEMLPVAGWRLRAMEEDAS